MSKNLLNTKPKTGKERRQAKRYPAKFLIRNRITICEDNMPVYKGLGIIRNISSKGMCLELKDNVTERFELLRHGKKIQLYIDLFFSGNDFDYCGEIAWISRPHTNRIQMGLDFNRYMNDIDNILNMFSDEKKIQERFFLNIL